VSPVLHLGRDVLEHDTDVRDRALRVAQRKERRHDRDPPSLGHLHLPELPRVVPDRRGADHLARERARDDVEDPVRRRDLVTEHAVLGRRLGAEQVPEGLIRQEAVAAGVVDLEPHRRQREQRLEDHRGARNARELVPHPAYLRRLRIPSNAITAPARFARPVARERSA
jgi:hypothetical protein